VGYCGCVCNNINSKHIYYIYWRLKSYSVFLLVVEIPGLAVREPLGTMIGTWVRSASARLGLEQMASPCSRRRDVRQVGCRLQAAVHSVLCGIRFRRSVFLLDGQERWCISMSSLLCWERSINKRMLELQNEWAGPKPVKVLSGGGDFSRSASRRPLSVSDICVWSHSWALWQAP